MIGRFNPFPGLRPFDLHEDYLFFGREGQSDELLRLLQHSHFVAVVGVSGSGKSSLVRAGLLPSLFGGFMAGAGSNWRVAMFRPGGDPIGKLAYALLKPEIPREDGRPDNSSPEEFENESQQEAADEIRAAFVEATLRRSGLGLVEAVHQLSLSDDENLLVVVDQFEELFRYRDDRANSAAFVRLLLEGSQKPKTPIYVVITMRSDYLGNCAQFQDLPEAINRSQYLIPRMNREQRRRAIEGPVAVGDAKISSRLVQRLLNDVGDSPDQLPILQHALMRTWTLWDQRESGQGPLDLPHYEATGGMATALSKHADEIYKSLPDERSRCVAETVFKRLTEVGADNRGVRRPTAVAELIAVAGENESYVLDVINAFRQPGCTFLAPPSDLSLAAETIVDISHESLMRVWQQLDAWVQEEARSAATYRRLAESARLYSISQASLLQDPELQMMLDWREKQRPNSAWAERYGPDYGTAMEFLQQSELVYKEKLQEEKERRRAEFEYYRQLIEESQVRQRLSELQRLETEESFVQWDPSRPMVLQISVAHGNLIHAEFPVVVGHYDGDALSGAEAELDRVLDRRLSRRNRLQLYPGPVGTVEVLLAPKHTPSGGIVLGLGEPDRLTSEALTQGVMAAALQYALLLVENLELQWKPTQDFSLAQTDQSLTRPIDILKTRSQNPQYIRAALSTVLIGTGGYRSLSIAASIASIVKGVILTNRALRQQGMWDLIRVDEIQFIELYEDLAIHAAHSVQNLNDSLGLTLENSEEIRINKELKHLEGGLMGRLQIENDPNRWTRLQIGTPYDSTGFTSDGLFFIQPSERSSQKYTLHATQLALTDAILREIASLPSFDPDFPSVLGEMLLPNALKELLQKPTNLQLILDTRAARYPWEMLAGQGKEPLAVRVSILRQLYISIFRHAVWTPPRNNALVIGEPHVPTLPPIPGARAEAEHVAERLTAYGYSVTLLVNATTVDIVNKLFAGEYHIIHLAGHGIYNPERPGSTGLVIGPDIYLSAVELGQLRILPRLVFMNCGHLVVLNHDGPDATTSPPTISALPDFAASCAEGLTQIGVSTLLVSGWSVDDAASITFVDAFYSLMLEGHTLGEAVLASRMRTYQEHPHINTWGAFQCYGIPGFSLAVKPGRRKSHHNLYTLVTPNELIQELEDFQARVAAGLPDGLHTELEWLRTIRGYISEEWMTPATLHALGNAFSAINEFEEAIRYLRQAISTPKSQVPLATWGQLAVLEARYGVQVREQRMHETDMAAHEDLDTKSRELFDSARRRINKILELTETLTEWLVLAGSVYKFIAFGSSNGDRKDALTQAAKYYRMALKSIQHEKTRNPSIIQNYVTCYYPTTSGQLSDVTHRELLELLDQGFQAAQVSEMRSPNYLNQVSHANGMLLKALIENQLAQQLNEIRLRYMHVFATAPIYGQHTSTLDYLNFLREMVSWRGDTEAARLLTELYQELTNLVGV